MNSYISRLISHKIINVALITKIQNLIVLSNLGVVNTQFWKMYTQI